MCFARQLGSLGSEADHHWLCSFNTHVCLCFTRQHYWVGLGLRLRRSLRTVGAAGCAAVWLYVLACGYMHMRVRHALSHPAHCFSHLAHYCNTLTQCKARFHSADLHIATLHSPLLLFLGQMWGYVHIERNLIPGSGNTTG